MLTVIAAVVVNGVGLLRGGTSKQTGCTRDGR